MSRPAGLAVRPATPSWRRRLNLAVRTQLFRVERAFTRKDYVVRSVHGNRMYLPLRNSGVTADLAIHGTREELETEIFRSEVRPGMVVVDLGANIGYYTLLAASLVGPTGMVYAIEPYPESFRFLEKNVEINGYSQRVECTRLAISDRAGTATLFLGSAANLHTLVDLSPHMQTSGKSIVVETMSLDQLMSGRRPVDFLRMDIEGAECQVFDGMDRVLAQPRPPKILFEVHPVGDIDPDPRYGPRLDRLCAMGYRPEYVVSSSNRVSISSFAELGYSPKRVTPGGQGLFEGIAVSDLGKVAARRPKITRAILLVHSRDEA